MSKVKIKLIILGQLPVDLDKIKLTKWKSDVFEIVGQIDNYSINIFKSRSSQSHYLAVMPSEVQN